MNMLARACALGVLLATNAARAEPSSQPVREPEELFKKARRIQHRTSLIRGLRARRKISMGLMTRQQIVERIADKLAKEYSDEELASEAAVLKRLGLLPANIDYKNAVLDLLMDQVAGFYDPAKRKLNLARWLSMDLQEPALAHEICHALQDQHFGLKRYIKPFKDNSDLQLARAALVEGDCTGVMLEYLLRDANMDLGSMPSDMVQRVPRTLAGSRSETFNNAPAFLKKTLLFPYLHGLSFVQRIRTRHPWQVVSRMFRRPPQSSEQILHYEKYWGRERPVRIRRRSLRSPAGAGYRLIKQDVLGEFQLSLYLALGVAEKSARRAAEGWGGDMLAAYGKEADSLPLLIHLTTWDSEADALEFSDAQRHVLINQGLAVMPDEKTSLWIFHNNPGLQWSVQLVDRHVLVLHGAPAELRTALQQQVWKRWRIGGRRVRP